MKDDIEKIGRVETARLQALVEARAIDNAASTATHTINLQKRLALNIAGKLTQKLNRLIAEGHEVVAFSIALMLAVAKDALDIGLDYAFGIGEIPFVGQIPGYFLSAFLTLFLYGKGRFLRQRIRVLYFIAGLFFDNLPAFNNLPLNTLMMFYAWHIVKKRAHKARQDKDRLGEMTEDEMQKLDEELGEVAEVRDAEIQNADEELGDTAKAPA